MTDGFPAEAYYNKEDSNNEDMEKDENKEIF